MFHLVGLVVSVRYVNVWFVSKVNWKMDELLPVWVDFGWVVRFELLLVDLSYIQCVRIVQKTVLWQFCGVNVSWSCFNCNSEMCHKTVILDVTDSFVTVLWKWIWQFYDIFIKIDTFMRDLWISCDRFMTDLWKWQIYDSYRTV